MKELVVSKEKAREVVCGMCRYEDSANCKECEHPIDDIQATDLQALKVLKALADAKIERLERELRDCRNELCLRCGEYKTKHLGSCDCCRWKGM